MSHKQQAALDTAVWIIRELGNPIQDAINNCQPRSGWSRMYFAKKLGDALAEYDLRGPKEIAVSYNVCDHSLLASH